MVTELVLDGVNILEMADEVTRLREATVTQVTDVWLLSRVYAFMLRLEKNSALISYFVYIS